MCIITYIIFDSEWLCRILLEHVSRVPPPSDFGSEGREDVTAGEDRSFRCIGRLPA